MTMSVKPDHVLSLLSQRALGGARQGGVQARLNSLLSCSLELSTVAEVDTRAVSHGLACMQIDPEDGRYLISGALDGSLYIHDTLARDPASQLALHVGRSNKHCHTAYVSSVSWGQDTGLFLSSSRDGTLKVWDSNEGRPADQFSLGEGGVTCHSPAPGNLSHLVALATHRSCVRLVDLRAGSTSHTLKGHGAQVTCLSWSPLRPSLLASGEGLGDDGRGGGKIILWDVRQAKSKLRSLDYNDVRGKVRDDKRVAGPAHQGRVLGVVFTGCGRYLLSVGKDKRVRKWDVFTGRNMKTKFPHVDFGPSCSQPWTVPLACTSGGSRDFLLVPERSVIQRLEMETGSSLGPLEGHYGAVTALTYSGARMALTTGDRERHILVWEPGEMG